MLATRRSSAVLDGGAGAASEARAAAQTVVSTHRGSRWKDRAGHEAAKVLWIDDDPLVRARGAEYLQQRGFRVESIAGGTEAPGVVPEFEPDVVILEVSMHDFDGMDLLRAIRARNPSLPLIIYSRTPSYRDDFTSWLADDYLVKCGDLSPLGDAIDAVLRVRG